MQTIILGGGCFWCTESVFSHVKGVTDVTSGYMGGDEVSANYKAVCGGDTGHVEVIKVDFDETLQWWHRVNLRHHTSESCLV